jgi:hypothetical protein
LDEGYLVIIRPRSEDTAVQLKGLVDHDTYHITIKNQS